MAILLAIILLFIAIIQLFSVLFLENFYQSNKKKTLKESFNLTEQIITKEKDFEEKLSALQDNKNVTIIILDSEYEPFFRLALLKRPAKYQNQQSRSPMRHDEELISSYLDKFKGGPVILTRKDRRTKTEFLSLYSAITLPDGTRGYAVISTSIDAMKDSVKAASDFILYTSLFVGLIGTAVVLYVSDKISKPIIKINRITSKMAKMDFSERITVDSSDETGELANNINFLSKQLDLKINELAIANKQLKKDIQLKEKVEQSRKELLSNVSHELKTPISLIGGYTEGLKLNINKDDKELYCDVIIDETKKMDKLVLSLLDLAQVEAGYKKMNLEKVDITQLVAGILDKYKLVFAEKGINLHNSFQGTALVMADEERLEQVVTNYLNNALDYVDNNRIISVSIEETKNQIRVGIFNSGKPIESAQLERIWDSFYKIDKARTREYGGSGLGLSIVKAIIHLHEGEYGVRNLEDGVEFWFLLNKYISR
ncbi:sensor histidine kinase [Fictibacillus fluitans]|uniref:histidine kinase n=1 Tax=Fictibacillus fluitans TaxID=3058422 RepID=A0ABT8HS93_9BACL|nr:HAMP domain-containing sensor histidine kinase [Fictibacillus sp. NE201]MDN4523355.1 HAMP domain-containing sensor histidine kinase [Fictibacillus sp. NE201]